ncbi:unnamed protein product [Leptosia nina]|uniref:Uncharacterized protein n=1 Tax=Leptosia nina TaxID=320188 RepID=A0AAV1J6T3_9NEOP
MIDLSWGNLRGPRDVSGRARRVSQLYRRDSPEGKLSCIMGDAPIGLRNELDTRFCLPNKTLTVSGGLKVLCFKRKPIWMYHLCVVVFKWPGVQSNPIHQRSEMNFK